MPGDTVVAAGVRIIANKLAGTDAQPVWRVMGDGKMEWGATGAATPDVNLYRVGSNNLKTDDSLDVANLNVAQAGAITVGDVYAYRSTTNTLRLANNFVVDGTLTAGGQRVPVTTYSSTPPASPADGDVWVYPADSANGVTWRFRYNAASGSAYKWEFLGGPPLYSAYDAAISVNSTAWSSYGGAPTITVGRQGEYDLYIEGFVNASGNSNWATAGMGVYINGDLYGNIYAAANVYPTVAAFTTASATVRTSFFAGDVLLQAVVIWAQAGTGAIEFYRRRMTLSPIRVL